MKIFKVTGTVFDNLRRLSVKVWNGKSDTRTAIEVGPYGIDSNPVKEMVAIYARTELDGKEVVIGYMNKNRLAEIGETRLFSTSASGTLMFYAWLKNNGTLELGGVTHNMVRYTPLNLALQNEAAAINVELGKIAAVLNALVPGSYTPVPVTIDITAAKINEIKTL